MPFTFRPGKEVLTWHRLSRVLIFKIREMAFRIRELRQIEGLTTAEMATKTDISEEDYIRCEEGTGDLTFAFIYRCALALGVDVSDIIEGSSPTECVRRYTQRAGTANFGSPLDGVLQSGGGFQKPHRRPALRYQQI